MLKLSVIVPVYNVSKYLAKCLDSLLAQDLKPEEYEIIVVNDGSTDNSGEIAKEYAETHSNIKLINQENQGLSGARNTGIKVAKGKYMQFVDSDDFLEPNVLKRLVDKMDSDSLDVLRFNYQNVNENYEVYEPYKEHKPFVDYRDEVCDGLTFLTERLGYACYAVQFIIKSDLLKKDGNLFKTGIYFEDTEWTPRILTQAHRVTSTDFMVYNYLLRSGSITQTENMYKRIKLLDDQLYIIKSMIEQMKDKKDKRYFLGTITSAATYIIGRTTTDLFYLNKKYIIAMNELGVFPMSNFHSSGNYRKKIYLMNISPRLYSCFMHTFYRLNQKLK